MAATREFQDVACTACGCVCDDLQVTTTGDRVTKISPDCALAERWFLHEVNELGVATAIRGDACRTEEAFEQATRLLAEAKSPLVYGLSSSSTDGQRAAVRLADAIGATIDTSASTCHGPSILALQQVGESTCTLGEIRNRADFVMYWGSNPAESHPRHMSRYALDPEGQFVRGGRADRTLVVVDCASSETARQADFFLQVEPDSDFDVLWALRSLLKGLPLRDEPIGGVPLAALEDLALRMRNCRCGVVFFGNGLTRGRVGHASVQALLSLVTELNAYTRFHARRMRVYGDVAGADTVLCWQTGFPFSVSLSRGFPRYGPGEYSADDLLRRGEADCCLLVGSEGISTLSEGARKQLTRIPTILLDRPRTRFPNVPTVRFATAIYGIHRAGTAYRMDEVPIPLRRFLESPLPSDGEILRELTSRLGAPAG